MVALDEDAGEWPLRFGPTEFVRVKEERAMTNE